MPGVKSTVIGATPVVPLNGYYPKLLSGKSGSIWLVAAPKTGTIVHLSQRPQKTKHKLGYFTTRLDEAAMAPFKGSLTLALNG